MSNTIIVFGFIATDQPGIVNTLSNTIQKHEGNWLESRLSHLGGLFSGLISVNIADSNVKALEQALLALKTEGILVNQFSEEKSSPTENTQRLELIGPDRKGIVQEVSQALAAEGINILKMRTTISSAPMSGEQLFNADILFSSESDNATLYEKLDAIADKLTLDSAISEQD